MTRKQTRRSVSITGELYEALKRHASETGQTGSGITERVLREYLKLSAPIEAKSPIEGKKVRKVKPADVVNIRTEAVVDMRPTADVPPARTYGMSKRAIEARKVEPADPESRRAGNIFSF